MSSKSNIIIKKLIEPPIPFRRIDSVSIGSIVTWGSTEGLYIKITNDKLLKIEAIDIKPTYVKVDELMSNHIILLDVELKIINKR